VIPVTEDVTGNEQPKAPSYAGSLGIQYEFDLGPRGFLIPRIQSQFQGRTFYRVFNRDEFSNEDFIKYDAKLTWRSENERYALELYGVNLTDEEVLNSLFVGSTFTGGQVLGQYQPPRTYGVKLSVNYVADWIEDLL
jgi:iron complex outermembrane receptor protein